MNLMGRNEAIMPYFKVPPGICLEVLRKPEEPHRQGYLNPLPPEHEVQVVTTQQRGSFHSAFVSFHNKTISYTRN